MNEKTELVKPHIPTAIVDVMLDRASGGNHYLEQGAIVMGVYNDYQVYYDTGKWKQTPKQACRTSVQRALSDGLSASGYIVRKRKHPITGNVQYYLKKEE